MGFFGISLGFSGVSLGFSGVSLGFSGVSLGFSLGFSAALSLGLSFLEFRQFLWGSLELLWDFLWGSRSSFFGVFFGVPAAVSLEFSSRTFFPEDLRQTAA